MERKFPPRLRFDPLLCGRNSWRFISLSYRNHVSSLESLQISVLSVVAFLENGITIVIVGIGMGMTM